VVVSHKTTTCSVIEEFKAGTKKPALSGWPGEEAFQ
jgi:hypothetical protein